MEDTPELLVARGLPPGRTPSVATLHRLFKTLDVAAFEHALGQWLRPTGVRASDAVGVDGKTLRGAAHAGRPGLPGAQLVAASTQEAHEIVAQVARGGKGQELGAAQQVLSQLPLAGRVVSADALATQREVCEPVEVVDAKGAYRLPVKENPPALLTDCQAAFSPVERNRAGGDGHAKGASVVSAGAGGSWGRPASRQQGGTQGAARPAGGAAAVGAGGARSQRSPGGVRRA